MHTERQLSPRAKSRLGRPFTLTTTPLSLTESRSTPPPPHPLLRRSHFDQSSRVPPDSRRHTPAERRCSPRERAPLRAFRPEQEPSRERRPPHELPRDPHLDARHVALHRELSERHFERRELDLDDLTGAPRDRHLEVPRLVPRRGDRDEVRAGGDPERRRRRSRHVDVVELDQRSVRGALDLEQPDARVARRTARGLARKPPAPSVSATTNEGIRAPSTASAACPRRARTSAKL